MFELARPYNFSKIILKKIFFLLDRKNYVLKALEIQKFIFKVINDLIFLKKSQRHL